MNRRLKTALQRCPAIQPKRLGEFLGTLLDKEPEHLARLPGSPATVLAAQFTYYAKTSTDLADVLIRQTDKSRKLADLLWRLSQPAPAKYSAASMPPSPTEIPIHGPHPSPKPAPAPCHACRTPCL